MSRIYTLEELKSTLHPVFEQFGVRSAVLFGSYAKGLGGLGKNFINPALAGRCFLLISFGTATTRFPALDGVTAALEVPVDMIDVSQVDKGSPIEREIENSGVQIYG